VVIIGDGKILADATLQSIRELSGAASMEEAFLQVLSRAAGVG
jgi:ABC-type Na+ transport system ATPase subunit NatA